jgi:hypothetical protein
MEGLLILGIVIVLFVALDVAALRWGVDSRDSSVDRPPRQGSLSAR